MSGAYSKELLDKVVFGYLHKSTPHSFDANTAEILLFFFPIMVEAQYFVRQGEASIVFFSVACNVVENIFHFAKIKDGVVIYVKSPARISVSPCGTFQAFIDAVLN